MLDASSFGHPEPVKAEGKRFKTILTSIIIVFGVLSLTLVLVLYRPANDWFSSETQISNLQSIFQLGTATSIAFALGRPYFRHALGPDFQQTIFYISKRRRYYRLPEAEFQKVMRRLHEYRSYESGLVALSQPYFFGLFGLSALFDAILLFWSSVINPTGYVLSRNGLFLCFGAMILCLVGVVDAYIAARRMRTLLRQARFACDSGKSEETALFCQKVEQRMKKIRLGDYPF